MWRKVSLLGIAVLTLAGCGKRANDIKVGWIGVLSGEYSFYGLEVRQGTEIALDEVNAKLQGKNARVEVIYEDDQLTPRLGVSAFQKLVDIDRVPVVIQATGSSVMLANAPIAEARKVVYISPTCGNPKIRDAGDYIFRNFPSDDFQGKVLARFAAEYLKANTAAIVYINNDHGVSIKSVIREEFGKLKKKILAEESFEEGSTDYRSQITKIKLLKPDVVFLPCYSREGALAVRSAKELGLTVPIIATDGAYSPDFLKLAGSSAEGVYVTNLAWNVKDTTELVRSFVERYRMRFKTDPTAYAAAGYDCMKILGHIFEIGARSSDQIKNSLYQTKNFEGVTGKITFDSLGEVSLPYDIFVVRKNQFVKFVTMD